MTRSIDPIVSTEWLAAHLAAGGPAVSPSPGGFVMIDIREPHTYRAGHIRQAISVPFGAVSAWATSTDELLMEVPETADLFKVIGDCGVDPDSKVVIVGTLDKAPAPPYSLADATRVAATLIYAGVENVAILDGGHPTWVQQGRETTAEVPELSPVTYSSTVRRETFLSTEQLKERIGKVSLVDGRDPDQYFGVTVDPFAGKAGHIPTAKSLPAPWIWQENGTYKPTAVLEQMVAGVVGPSKSQEITAYCGVGGYASAWWFVLTQILGYADVTIYDGGAEAWAKDNAMVMYSWAL